MFEDEIGTANHVPEPPEPYLFEVGEMVDGRYLVRAQLGNGGMGAVLRVEDQATHETLALKYCKRGQDRRRFAREVRLMEGIHSPHVIPIFGSNLDHEPHYFVMPLAERSLESDLPSLVGDEATALEIFRQVCLGVQYLHGRGVFHRDLKPANVLRLTDGRTVVCDLGLARPESRDTTVLTRSIGWVGTEAYLAPEQRQPEGSRNSDARTDVYQLGKVLYQIVTGKHPRSVNYSKLPGGLDHIVKKATSEDPRDRYQTVEKLIAALGAYRSSKDPSQNPREVLEHLVDRIEVGYPGAVPPTAHLTQILETLSHGGWLEHNLVIECFHRVRVRWLPAMARDQESLLHSVLGAYATAIHERVGGYNYEFADDVSERMRQIYDHSLVVRTRVLSLRNLMTAADMLGRWAPQRTFCGYLEGIKTIDMALPVAEMITEFARPSVRDFQGFNMEMYHPAIQTALKGLRIKPSQEENLEEMEQPSPPDLRATASDNVQIEAHQALRRASDLKTLTNFFAQAPRQFVARFLEEALGERIHIEILNLVAQASEYASSPIFHLYDKELWRLIREFLQYWNEAYEISRSTYHDYGGDGFATPIRRHEAGEGAVERQAQFLESIAQARDAFALLNSHVREEYPDFDFERIDKIAAESYRAWKDDETRETSEFPSSSEGGTGK